MRSNKLSSQVAQAMASLPRETLQEALDYFAPSSLKPGQQMKVLNGKVIVRVEKTPKFHGSFVFPEGVRLSTQFAHVMAFDEDHDRARDLSIGLIVLTPHYDGVEFNPLPELKWKEGNYIILPIEDLLAKAINPEAVGVPHDVSYGIGDEKVNYG